MAFKAGGILGEAVLDDSQWMKSLKGLLSATTKVAGLLAAAFTAALVKSTFTAKKFQVELANTSTLLDLNTVSMQKMSASLINLDPALGKTTELTRALYQSFSSGADTMKEAMQTTKDAAVFGKAALTDTFTAVDVLTSAVNAYGKEVITTTQASDIFFTTIKKGKITGQELSGVIGQSIPLFSKAGISLEELAAGMATMTKQGVKSSETTTQLNAIVNSFLKPSKKMTAELHKLGFASGAAFLESEGLTGALKFLENAAGGNNAVLAQLLPNIRALRGAMALTGEGSKEFADILLEMENSAGATKEAFDKQELTWETFGNSLEKTQILVGNISKFFVDKLIVPLTELNQKFILFLQSREFMEQFTATAGTFTGALSAAFTAGKLLFSSMYDSVKNIVPTFKKLVTNTRLLSKEINRFLAPILDIDTHIQNLKDNVLGMGKEINDLITEFTDFAAELLSGTGLIYVLEAVSLGFLNTGLRTAFLHKIVEKLSDGFSIIKEAANNVIEPLVFFATKSEKASIGSKLLAYFINKVSLGFHTMSVIITNSMTVLSSFVESLTSTGATINTFYEFLKGEKQWTDVKESAKLAGESFEKMLDTVKETTVNTFEEIEKKKASFMEDTQKLAEEIEVSFTSSFDRTEQSLTNAWASILLGTEDGGEEVKDEIEENNNEIVESNLTMLERLKKGFQEFMNSQKIAWEEFKKDTLKVFITIYEGALEISNIGLSGWGDLSSQAFTNESAKLTNWKNEELDTLQARYDAGLISQEDYEQKKAAINQEALDKENELKKKEFLNSKALNIAQIWIDAAAAILGFWQAYAGIPFIGPAIAGTLTASVLGIAGAQTALIAQQQFVPARKDGGLTGGPTLINEIGGEIVDLPDGSLVIPNDISRQIAENTGKFQQGSSITNYVNFKGAIIKDDFSLDKVVNSVVKQLSLLYNRKL